MTEIMNGRLFFESDMNNKSSKVLNSICLEDSERLLVHMDCMNAFGQIVKIEDVDDMGGQVIPSSIPLFLFLVFSAGLIFACQSMTSLGTQTMLWSLETLFSSLRITPQLFQEQQWQHYHH
jgi:hypothetical protein